MSEQLTLPLFPARVPGDCPDELQREIGER